MTMGCVAPAKGRNDYAMRALHLFVFECGWPNGILQTDPENAISALFREVAVEFSVKTRMSFAYSSRSQGECRAMA
eukprot:8862781-Lingulodinium_polyedra.AAC.1